jgi:Urate oxidase N-terminal
MEIFHRYGLWGGFRIAHVMFAVMWMGLLWFFNFVQTPAYAEMEPSARNNAFDKLTWRALWWFRFSAMFTVASGILVLLIGGFGDSDAYQSGFWKSPSGMGLITAILFALIMLYNVLGVIWPNQQIVIGNARNVQAGGEADPDAAAAGRKALLASRMNAIFSLPMLIFMVGTAHFPYNQLLPPEGSKRAIYWGVTLVIWAVLEANALGWIGGTKPGGTNTIFDTHKNALITGFVLAVVWLLLFSLVLAR